MMNQKSSKRMPALLLAVMMLIMCGSFACADELSSDDSLSSLGISTPIVSIDPEFYYSTIEYEVVVPAGTESISLDPVPSDANATVSDISGTELDDDGEAIVEIQVTAQAGNTYSYFLYVTSEDDGEALRAARQEAAAAQPETETEPPTEAPTEEETEPETEDSRYVSVARETLEEAESTIDALKEETTLYRNRGNMILRIMYGLIALCVILLFIVINLLLRNRDIRSELNDYRGLDYSADQDLKEPPEDQEDAGEEIPEEEGEEEQEDLEQEPEEEEEEEEPVSEDDPSTVPKPSDAKQRSKRMPKYEAPQKNTPYEPPKDAGKDSDSVDVEFIDL